MTTEQQAPTMTSRDDARVAIQHEQRQQVIATFRSMFGTSADAIDVEPGGAARIGGLPIEHRPATERFPEHVVVGRDIGPIHRHTCDSLDAVLEALVDHDPDRIHDRADTRQSLTMSATITRVAVAAIGVALGVAFLTNDASLLRAIAVVLVVGSIIHIAGSVWTFYRRHVVADQLRRYAAEIEHHHGDADL